jgi:hypothetical protein
MSRELALELDQHGNAIEHPGTARGVFLCFQLLLSDCLLRYKWTIVYLRRGDEILKTSDKKWL